MNPNILFLLLEGVFGFWIHIYEEKMPTIDYFWIQIFEEKKGLPLSVFLDSDFKCFFEKKASHRGCFWILGSLKKKKTSSRSCFWKYQS